MPCAEEGSRLPLEYKHCSEGRKCLSSSALQLGFVKTYFQSGLLEAFLPASF